MKLKLIVVDLELTRRQKRVGAVGLAVAIALGSGAAFADLPKTFVAGETLKAADLMANFDALDGRLVAVEADAADLNVNLTTLEGQLAALDGRVDTLEAPEAPPTVLEATSNTQELGALGADLVYQSMSLDLTPGTWRVDAFASVTTTVNPDAIQIGLWDDTNQVEVAGARGPFVSTTSFSTNPVAACNGTSVQCTSQILTTSKTLTVSTPTTLRLAAFRNGASALRLNGGVGLAVQPSHRLVATKIH